ncbi:hypothetical protein V6N11_075113 [Hibiscus sabdariffa]|uniref:RNase H type-1 domain-containing protein n=1 Tax=Hibiscus sabdariffa TaxID=183260 RepID=A0ABR2R5Z9_9ROSI
MGGRMKWGACFSVWCWLLWKFRCSRVLDEDFIEREGIYDRGSELWAVLDGLRHAWAVNCRRVELETDNKEVERILKHDSESLGASALVMSIHEWLRKDWVVIVRHVPRECNGVADSLAALGRDYGWQGSTFPTPPWGIVHRLDDERQQWLSTRPVQRFVDDPG